jgi:hypothetical protein
MGYTLMRITIMQESTVVDTHTDAQRSFSWLIRNPTEQIYDTDGRDCCLVCIQGLTGSSRKRVPVPCHAAKTPYESNIGYTRD